MGFDAAWDGFRYLLLLEGRDEARGAARTEGDFLQRRKSRDGRRDLRYGRAQPLAILLRGEDWDLEQRGALNQAHGILHDALLLENGRQQAFLHVHNYQAGFGPREAKRFLMHRNWNLALRLRSATGLRSFLAQLFHERFQGQSVYHIFPG